MCSPLPPEPTLMPDIGALLWPRSVALVGASSDVHSLRGRIQQAVATTGLRFYMVGETFTGEGRMEKAFRWLGFVQGCLWACRVYTVDQLKHHNMP